MDPCNVIAIANGRMWKATRAYHSTYSVPALGTKVTMFFADPESLTFIPSNLARRSAPAVREDYGTVHNLDDASRSRSSALACPGM